ncbi:MAG: PVC-type heme-binding CxxCH protein [Opitutaceae bacterium]
MKPTPRIVPFVGAILMASALAAISARGATFKFPAQSLTVPDGFTVELVAGPPLVNRPIAIAFDERGRLYAADSSGLSDRAPIQFEQKPHRIMRLEATHGDGRFDRATEFADKMMFPQGALFHEGSLYVAAPPHIWKLTDTDGDGVADKREIWWDGGTLTGCANDVHGPYLGPDGWLYWTKGAFAEQKHTLGDGSAFVSRAAHIYRARPDGSRLEPVLTGGMDNPVGLTFAAHGERFLSGTFFITPSAGQRDGLIHSIYGGVYGKENAASAGHPRTGDLMPMMTHMGAAAPCGSTTYRSGVFGADYTDNLFVCYFNLRKIARHVLVPAGATFTTRDTDFVTSDSPDFHPTDVLEDADGSLLIVDTGGWYKICCPSSQLAKPDVLGGIYRVRKIGAPRAPARLAEPHADLWAHALRETPEARAAVRARLGDKDPAVVKVALQIASLWRDAGSFEFALPLLASDDAAISRLAAETLGRLRNPRAIEVLLKSAARLAHVPRTATGTAASSSDRAIEHALTYALIEIGKPEELRSALRAAPAVARVALVALDQMPGGNLLPSDVLPSLNASDSTLQPTATWIVSHRPEWGDALAQHFRARLAPSRTADLAPLLSQLASAPAIQQLLADMLRTANRSVALTAMREAALKQAPASWLAALVPLLDGPSHREAVATVRMLALPKNGHADLLAALADLGRNPAIDAATRLDALTLAAPALKSVDSLLLDFLLAQLGTKQPLLQRSAAATALAKAPLSSEQQLQLVGAMASIGAIEAPKLLPAFERQPTELLGLALVDALRVSRGLAGVRVAQLKPLFAKYPSRVQTAAAPLLESLHADLAKQNARIDALLPTLTGGDINRGHLVFNSEKNACTLCHKIGYRGGLLGPDLTTIGKIRTARDLLEAIVFPSATLVRGYEPLTVTTKAGESHTGLVRKDDADEVVLATGPETTQHISRAEIVDLLPSNVSPMPPGMDAVLTPQELADLIAFLKSRT